MLDDPLRQKNQKINDKLFLSRLTIIEVLKDSIAQNVAKITVNTFIDDSHTLVPMLLLIQEENGGQIALIF